MKISMSDRGFSLIEINMAVFVMALGILSMVVLFPLGLRESIQGAADLKQSMFADYALNQCVAAASSTNVTWAEWKSLPSIRGSDNFTLQDVRDITFLNKRLDWSGWNRMNPNSHFRVGCCLVPGTGLNQGEERVVGFMVQSTDQFQTMTDFTQFTNNPIYYAEALFQGTL